LTYPATASISAGVRISSKGSMAPRPKVTVVTICALVSELS
jgi:hypothetical protein